MINDRIPGTTFNNPIWYRDYRIYICTSGPFAYEYQHKDFDGNDDPRHGACHNIEQCKAEIDEREDDA